MNRQQETEKFWDKEPRVSKDITKTVDRFIKELKKKFPSVYKSGKYLINITIWTDGTYHIKLNSGTRGLYKTYKDNKFPEYCEKSKVL